MKRKRNDEISHAELIKILKYCPKTGVFVWRINKTSRARAGQSAGFVRPDGYCTIRIDLVRYRAHRLAWLYMTGKWPKDQIDHADGNPRNNRWSNLRESDQSQNMQNGPIRNKSGLKGASKCTHQSGWFSRIHVNGRSIFLGNFSSAEDAHAAYVAAAQKYFGKFARAA